MKQSDFFLILPARVSIKNYLPFSHAPDLICLRHVTALILANVRREWRKEFLNLQACDYTSSFRNDLYAM
jgi:hypothetical protein